MSLIDLIEKHRASLSVPLELSLDRTENMYAGFVHDLINLPSFGYSREDIRLAIGHMEGKLPLPQQFCVAAYAIRRAALQAIPNAAARAEILELMDKGYPLIEENRKIGLQNTIADYINRNGDSLEDWLLSAEKVLVEIKGSLDLIYQEDTSILDGKGRAIYKMRNYHFRACALELVRLRNILNIVRSGAPEKINL